MDKIQVNEEMKQNILALAKMTGDRCLNCWKALRICGNDIIKASEYLNRYTWDSHGFKVDKSRYDPDFKRDRKSVIYGR